MPAAPLPPNEAQRLNALKALEILDTPPEERFDRITRIAGRLLNVPICTVNFLDQSRQFSKSRFGTEAVNTPRAYTFCTYAILNRELLVVPDAKLDARFADSPLVTGEPFIRFYAGYPLSGPDGSLVGSLCVIDQKPRMPSEEDLQALIDLGEMVEEQLATGQVKEALRLHHEVEDRLRISEARFREVVDVPGRFVWETNAPAEGNPRMTFVSEQVKELLGYTPQEMLQRNLFDGIVAEDLIVVTAKLSYAMQKQQRFTDLEFRTLTKDGREIWISARGAPIFDAQGALTGYRGISEDVTERKQISQELVSSKEMAEGASRSKSDFLANMSHEIRTPMNAVVGMTGLLLGTELNVEQRNFAQTIRQSADQLLTIISDILDFSKIESGKLELEWHPFDLMALVEEAVDCVALPAGEKGLELYWHLAPDLPPGFEGDVTRLRQIIVNLLSNAVRFTSVGEVSVTVSRAQNDNGEHFVLFSVWDTGIGIPADKVGKLFQSFSQVDTSTTRKYGGTGLGLAISRKLVGMMGGSIWVESEEGKGSAFHFAVPLSEALPPKPLSPSPILKGKTLLFAGTHEGTRGLIESFGQKWGMTVLTFGRGSELIKQLKSDPRVAAILVEDTLPDREGKEVVAEVKKMRGGTDAPCFLLTSLRQQAAFGQNLPPGVVACLSKPPHYRHLHSVLASSLKGEKVTSVLVRSTGKIDAGFGQRRPLRILLAEDNMINQKVATRILMQMGYRPDVVNNGVEVIQALERQKYDVILMDIQMPQMDGLEATRQIRKQFLGPQRPWIIAMTANAMDIDQKNCFEAGMDGYLSKPVRIDALESELTRSSENIGQVVDFKVLARFGEMTGSGSEAVRELVEIFAEETPQALAQIRADIEARRGQAIGVQAMQLGRACANFGAERMQQMCSSLQTAGKSGDFTLAREFAGRLETEFANVKATLEEFADTPLSTI